MPKPKSKKSKSKKKVPPPPSRPTLLAMLLRLSDVEQVALARAASVSVATVHRLCAGGYPNKPTAGTWLLLSTALTRLLERPVAPEHLQALAETRSKDAFSAAADIEAILKKHPKKA